MRPVHVHLAFEGSPVEEALEAGFVDEVVESGAGLEAGLAGAFKGFLGAAVALGAVTGGFLGATGAFGGSSKGFLTTGMAVFFFFAFLAGVCRLTMQ